MRLSYKNFGLSIPGNEFVMQLLLVLHVTSGISQSVMSG